jgi:hypothetical protein
MYNYDRTAAANDSDDDTKNAIKWLLAERKKVIDRAFKEMGVKLDNLMIDAAEKFPNLDGSEVMAELRRREKSMRDNLQG